MVTKFNRAGVTVWPEIAAFLGGILFTAIIFLIQDRDEYNILININNIFSINQFYIIGFFLSIPTIILIFSSICFGISCTQENEDMYTRLSENSFKLFLLGMISSFISVIIVLSLIHYLIGIFGFVLITGIYFWWTQSVNNVRKSINSGV